jgi:hypothetical protein
MKEGNENLKTIDPPCHWLTKELTKEEIAVIRNRLKGFGKEQDGQLYIPESEGTERFLDVSENANIIEIKVIRKKVFRERDDTMDRKEKGVIYLAYKEIELRHVTYLRFAVAKESKLMVGVDVWKKLNTSDKLKELESDISKIFGKDFLGLLQHADLKKKAVILIDAENVIIKDRSDKIENTNQSVSFQTDSESIIGIKKELNDGSLKLEDIKTKHYSDDVKNNKAFQAVKGKSIDLITKGSKGAYFYYSNLTTEFEYFRFELHAAEGRIKLSFLAIETGKSKLSLQRTAV